MRKPVSVIAAGFALVLSACGTSGTGGNGNNAGNKPPGNPPNVPPPGRGIGRTLNEQLFSGVPPLGETRFLPEIVLQISNTISLDRVMLAAKKLGLTLIASQSFDAAGRVIYRFGTGGKDIRALILALEHTQIVAPPTVHKRFVAPLVRASCAVTA